ncbi:MAG: hypothetical protein HY000_02775 [Planctomycetes bacterium]|nr:hypothetical protein [Planctomycetota bacterium]
MSPKTPRMLFWIVVALTGGAAAALLIDAFQGERALRTESFQHLVGGLGLGPSLDGSRCWLSMDPRIEAVCHRNLWPNPGGGWFCPEHAGSVFYYDELTNE